MERKKGSIGFVTGHESVRRGARGLGGSGIKWEKGSKNRTCWETKRPPWGYEEKGKKKGKKKGTS